MYLHLKIYALQLSWVIMQKSCSVIITKVVPKTPRNCKLHFVQGKKRVFNCCCFFFFAYSWYFGIPWISVYSTLELLIKVAWVANKNLDWFFYNLIILIKKYKIPYKNLDKPLLFSTNQLFYLKILKLWRASTNADFDNFCWNCVPNFLLTKVYQKSSVFFLLCLELEVFAKIKNA